MRVFPWLVIAAATLAAAEKVPAGGLAPARGGELRLAIQAEPRTLHPLEGSDEISGLVRHLTSGTLVRLNRPRQALEPQLAVRWKVLGGGRSIRFELRTGVRFSDGTPFGPQDVCFTLERLRDPALKSAMAEAFRAGGTTWTCRADGPAAVVVGYPRPVVALEGLFDGVPVLSSRSPAKEKAGLGPFVVAEQKAGAHLMLARNRHYWKRDERGASLPYLDSIRLEILRNRDHELLRFRRGELHLVNNLDPELYEKLRVHSPESVRDLGVSLDTEQIWFNQSEAAPLDPHKKTWFRNREFRLAVSEAIRRADMVRIVFRGHATPAAGPVSPANRAWVNPALAAPRGDAEAALERLRRAGFRKEGGRLRDGAGRAVEFTLITNSGNKSRERMAALIQQDLTRIGIKVALVTLDFPSLVERLTRTLDYEACLLGWVHSDLDPNSSVNLWASSSGDRAWNARASGKDRDWEAELDRAARAQASALDPAERRRHYHRLQQVVADQLPYIFLVFRHGLVAIAPAVRGVEPSVLRPQTLWNAEELWLDSATLISRGQP